MDEEGFTLVSSKTKVQNSMKKAKKNLKGFYRYEIREGRRNRMLSFFTSIIMLILDLDKLRQKFEEDKVRINRIKNNRQLSSL